MPSQRQLVQWTSSIIQPPLELSVQSGGLISVCTEAYVQWTPSLIRSVRVSGLEGAHFRGGFVLYCGLPLIRPLCVEIRGIQHSFSIAAGWSMIVSGSAVVKNSDPAGVIKEMRTII